MQTDTMIRPSPVDFVEGGMAKSTMEKRKIVSMTDELAKAIEDYRFDKRISSEAEAVRLLLVSGLRAEGRRLEGDD